MDFDALYPAASIRDYSGRRPQQGGITTTARATNNTAVRARSVGSSLKEEKVSKWRPPKVEIDVFSMTPDDLLGRGRPVEPTAVKEKKEKEEKRDKSKKRAKTPAPTPAEATAPPAVPRNKLVKKRFNSIFIRQDKTPNDFRRASTTSDCCPKCKELPIVPGHPGHPVDFGQQEPVELDGESFCSIQAPAEFMMGPEDSMGAFNALARSGSMSRRTSRSSRYSQKSKDTMISSNFPGSRAPSIYTRAVTALPYSTQHFLDSLDENAPKPPVPLKIRPASKSPSIPREAIDADANLRLIETYEQPREWDMGWGDFDAMLDELQRDAMEDEKVRKAVKMVMGEDSVMSRPRPPRIKPAARSRWSDMSAVSPISTSSESSDIAPYYTGKSREVSLLSTISPAIAHLPDLESDVSSPSTPNTRGPYTPYLNNSFPPPPFRANFPPLPPIPSSAKSPRQSHISQCVSPNTLPGLKSWRASQSVTDLHLNQSTSAPQSLNNASQSVTNLNRVSTSPSPYLSMRRNHSSTIIVPSPHLYQASVRDTKYWSNPEKSKAINLPTLKKPDQQPNPYTMDMNPYASVLDIHPAYRDAYREEIRRARPEHYGVPF
ncbi:MAG: hypothetical protein MMC33_008396 [Icmadophila ericetorum]|nr:hypothetical protein [Icmadophila ericetorum]